LSRLRDIDSSLPVILITGYAQVLSPLQAFELGATDYIMKPFEPEILIGSLERALGLAHKSAN
jgi:FixJ family two-component response regulator